MRTSPFHTATVVLDTNVVVAALLWEGIPRNLLERIAGDSRLTLASSPVLMAELTRVLAKQQLRNRVLRLGATTDQLVANYKRLVSIVTPRVVPGIVAGDSDDDHVLALAVAARASLIISGDHAHLLPIGRYSGIAIVTPREAMTLLE